MLRVIGTKNCGRCISIKNALMNNNVEFEQILITDISENEREEILLKAKEKKQEQFPLIMKDDEIITLREALENAK